METNPTAINRGSQTRSQLESELQNVNLTQNRGEAFTPLKPEPKVIPIPPVLACQSSLGKGDSKAPKILRTPNPI